MGSSKGSDTGVQLKVYIIDFDYKITIYCSLPHILLCHITHAKLLRMQSNSIV